MSSDLETIQRILKTAGIVYEIDDVEEGTDIEIYSGEGKNNLGYSGFVSMLSFGKDGQLMTVGAWE